MATNDYVCKSTLATKVILGMRIAFCCSASEVLIDTVSPSRKPEFSKTKHINHSEKNKILPIPDTLLFRKSKRVRQEPSKRCKQRSNDEKPPTSPITSRRKVPSTKMRRKTSSEIWGPSLRKRSNWDHFYASGLSVLNIDDESQSTAIDWEISDNQTGKTIPDFQMSTVDDVTLYNIAKNGQVFLLYLSKRGMRSDWVSLETRLETVAAWLNEGSSYILPISEHLFPRQRKLNTNFRKLTIAETFGDRLNPEKEGINFFIGPVDGKISFKMTVCDLGRLKRISDSMIYRESEKESKDDESEIL